MGPYYKGMCGELYHGDVRSVLKELPDKYVHCCVTSPPYFGLRDYGVDGQLGLEKTPEKFVNSLVNVFREVKRVLRDDGTVWLNLGDSYNGSGGNHTENHKNDTGFQGAVGPRCGGVPTRLNTLKSKDLIGIPWRVAFALQADGWYLRQDIIWHKTNPMPESVRDRCTKAHEYIFLLSKSAIYYYDYEAIKEPSKYPDDNRKSRSGVKHKRMPTDTVAGIRPGSATYPKRNKRSVWTVSTKPFKGAHFAVFPPDLIEPCVLAGCPEGGTVLDPFMGSGTTALVAGRHNRRFAGIELNKTYLDEITIPRIKKEFDSILD